MPAPLHSEPTPEASSQPISSSAESLDLVYDLRLPGSSSDRFYSETSRFSEYLEARIELCAGDFLDRYSQFVEAAAIEPARSRGEYGVELLTLGMALRRYAGAAEIAPLWAVWLARGLYRLRRVSTWTKPAVDWLRAQVTGIFLTPGIGREPAPSWRPLRALPELLDWLSATGEFEQEATRLERWRRFLGSLSESESDRCLRVSMELFDWFQLEAAEKLGTYTIGVPRFLAGEHRRRGRREDQIFCGRQSVEYHLNMVAAEIMNRGLREDFERKSRKVVLVPACMRGEHASTCKARVDGTDITCTSCDRNCSVNRITRRMRTEGVEVFLVPHSTGFSRWLDRWQREPDCGVTAVACILNILPGGYEMRARGIASQCLPLDYPGCQKHWSREGISTGINEDRLVQIVTRPAFAKPLPQLRPN